MDGVYDIAVIGGGINGTAIAAEAATRGLRVLLCEQGDLANATSSASSKLIHGGLRYLEYHEYSLVKQALNERENLLKNAKHLVKPLRFIFPYKKINHSKFIIRLGLFIYDHLARYSRLPKTKTIKLISHPAGDYLKKDLKIAFEYTDAQTNDARLVIANAIQARAHGANIQTYTKCVQVVPKAKYWELLLQDSFSQINSLALARVIINATGPWVRDFIDKNHLATKHDITMVKGSHIVLPKLYDESYAYIFQNDDQRVIFVLPYLDEFHLIGTTDVIFTGDPKDSSVSEEEIDYLLAAVNRYFKLPIDRNKIVGAFSGVRSLLRGKAPEPSKLTRDYIIELFHDKKSLPFLSIFGGKLTTHRKLAESAINLLQPFFNQLQASVSADIPLPGADYDDEIQLQKKLVQQYPFLELSLLQRYQKSYGSKTFCLLDNCKNIHDLGFNFGVNLYQREVDYLIEHEWVKTTHDILWRRTTLGYHFDQAKIAILNNYIKEKMI